MSQESPLQEWIATRGQLRSSRFNVVLPSGSNAKEIKLQAKALPTTLFESHLPSLTTESEPLRQAACKHVVPLVSQVSGLAPSKHSHLTPAKLRAPENSSKKRSISFSSSRVSVKTAPAGSQVELSSKSSLSTPGCKLDFGQTASLQKTRFPISSQVDSRVGSLLAGWPVEVPTAQ